MLNELLLIERGLSQHGFAVARTHPDVKEVGQDAPLRVRLAADGRIVRIEIIEKEQARLWTLRRGQHNSFPYMKLGRPLLSLPAQEADTKRQAEAWKKLKDAGARRNELLRLVAAFPMDEAWAAAWPGPSLRKRIAERLSQLSPLREGDSQSVPAAFERFLAALDRPAPFLVDLLGRLIQKLNEGGDIWIAPVRKLMVENGTLYIDVDDSEFDRDAGDPANVGDVSRALAGGSGNDQTGLCSLTGETVSLHKGNFPQPNLPSLGQTYLFAKNREIPAAHRYSHFAAGAFPVGADVLTRLAGGLAAITEDHRKGVTWQLVPSEKPKQSDLLLAFLPGDLGVPIADVIAPESPVAAETALTKLSDFTEASKRTLAHLDGRVRFSEPEEGVQLCILRKVDPANRKAIFSRVVTADVLYERATRWREGTANHPSIVMRVPGQKGEKSRESAPLPISPADLPALTRKQFVRDGTHFVDLVGLTSPDAFALFLEEGDVQRRAHSFLRMVLQRQGPLLIGVAHALRRGLDEAKRYDRVAALRSVTLVGILLHKLERSKETFMNGPAFKLGQLLATADVVHVGYCADQRGGDVPPVLLGNSVLTMAQSKPTRALSVLCGRWKPYGAWAKRVEAVQRKAAELQGKGESGRAISMRIALSQARRVSDLCNDLSGALPASLSTSASDGFRAELLLGYLAGLPRKDDKEVTSTATEIQG